MSAVCEIMCSVLFMNASVFLRTYIFIYIYIYIYTYLDAVKKHTRQTETSKKDKQ